MLAVPQKTLCLDFVQLPLHTSLMFYPLFQAPLLFSQPGRIYFQSLRFFQQLALLLFQSMMLLLIECASGMLSLLPKMTILLRRVVLMIMKLPSLLSLRFLICTPGHRLQSGLTIPRRTQ